MAQLEEQLEEEQVVGGDQQQQAIILNCQLATGFTIEKNYM